MPDYIRTLSQEVKLTEKEIYKLLDCIQFLGYSTTNEAKQIVVLRQKLWNAADIIKRRRLAGKRVG